MTVATASRANVLWFLPTHGDGRHLGSTIGVRPVSINYLRQVTVSSSQRGHDRNCALVTLQIFDLFLERAWVATGSECA